jgi:hypothetical protein
MKRGFVTNELLIVIAIFAILLTVYLPLSWFIGWGSLGAFPLAIAGFVLLYCLLNSREIIDQLRARHRTSEPTDEIEHGDHNNGLA